MTPVVHSVLLSDTSDKACVIFCVRCASVDSHRAGDQAAGGHCVAQ